MKCVFLLGFSTTGKSSILCEFNKKYGESLDTLDSDKEVSKPDGAHIYDVYLQFRKGHDTKNAISEIERRERAFLQAVRPEAKPLLLAGGPFLPSREPEWLTFVDRVRPVLFYLQKTPEDVLTGLRNRRAKHNIKCPVLASDPGFGCWDQDVTTTYCDGRWVELEDDQALANIRKHMAGMVKKYEILASQTFTWQERQTPQGQERLNTAIRQELGL